MTDTTRQKFDKGWHKQALPVPEAAHPLVRLMFEEMLRQRVSYREIVAATGISKNSMTHWRMGSVPPLDKIDKVLRFLGIELWPVRVDKRPDHPSHDPVNHYIKAMTRTAA